MQSQIHLKKAGQTAKSREMANKSRNVAVLAPVMELNKKPKKDGDKADENNFKARYLTSLPPGGRKEKGNH